MGRDAASHGSVSFTAAGGPQPGVWCGRLVALGVVRMSVGVYARE